MFNFFKKRKEKTRRRKQLIEVTIFLEWLADHEDDSPYFSTGSNRIYCNDKVTLQNMIENRIDNPMFREVVSKYPNLEVANHLVDYMCIEKLDRYQIANALQWADYEGLNSVHSKFGRKKADVNNQVVYKAFIRRCKTIILFRPDANLFHEIVWMECVEEKLKRLQEEGLKILR
jgi:hypothetical protein